MRTLRHCVCPQYNGAELDPAANHVASGVIAVARAGEQTNSTFHANPVRYQGLGSIAGPRLSTIFLAVSCEMLGRNTTRQLHVPPFPGTLPL